MNLVSFEEFGKAFIPERVRPYIRRYLLKAGILDVPYGLFGLLFVLTQITTGIVYIVKIFPLIEQKNIFVLFLFSFGYWVGFSIILAVLFMVIIYSYLDLVIAERTRKIEEVLDDFLLLVSENLKGGMSLDKALWTSIKPEFGVLSKEIDIASKKVATGNDIDEALSEFIGRYDSNMTRRAFELIIEDTRGGGQIALTIDKIVDGIKETKLLKQEMVATNIQYVIFIMAVTIFVAPLLFALSYQLLIILMKFSAKLGPALKNTGSSMPFSITEMNINLDNFVFFSRVAIGIVAVSSSMIISEINRGDIKSGIKYIPLFLILALLIYSFFQGILTSLFSGLTI